MLVVTTRAYPGGHLSCVDADRMREDGQAVARPNAFCAYRHQIS